VTDYLPHGAGHHLEGNLDTEVLKDGPCGIPVPEGVPPVPAPEPPGRPASASTPTPADAA
jgi:hypothetical protein